VLIDGSLLHWHPSFRFWQRYRRPAMLPDLLRSGGSDQTMFTTMEALGIFFTMAQSVYQAIVNDVKDEAIDKAYTLGASDPEIIYEVIWKQVLPPIWTIYDFRLALR